MANQQISDRSALTTPATGDLMFIRDVSDTTDSVGGTDKKITIDNVASTLAGTGLSSSAATLNLSAGLADLTDVVSATNTNRFALMANGTTGYVGRALVEADISDLGSYITDISGFTTTDLTEGTNLYFTDERAQDAVGTIFVDSSEIDFTYTDATPSITASLIAGSIDETKLDTSVNASLDLADSALQNLVEDLTPSLGGELDAGGNNIVDLGDVTFQTGASGGTLRTGTSNADKFTLQAYDVNDGVYRTMIEADAGNDPYMQLYVDYLRFEDVADATKIAKFSVAGITTGTTRTFTFPDATGTLALTTDLHDAVTVTDSSEIDFTLTGQDITASLVAGSIDETKLDTSVNASLDLADSAVQPASTDTLTNKTIDGDNNTISNLDIGNEVDWASATDVADAGTPDTGDKLLIFEAGVGLRKIDWSALPSGSGASQLSELSDVDASVATPSDGDILVYRDAGSDWVLEAKPASGSNPAINDITDITITSVADNELLAYDTTSGDWINQTPTEAGFATVATTGAYSDLSGTPTVPADLADLSDVVSATNTNRYVLVANGTTGYVGRALVEADISDLGSYITDLSSFTTTDLTEGTNLYYTEARVSANTDVAANTSARHSAVTVTDSSEIDFTLTGQNITASIVAGSIDETKLDTSVNASLDLADSALQSGDNVSALTNDAGYITATLTDEQVQDIVGAMVATNTETLITVTYQDIDGTLDFVVEDDLSLYDNTTSGFITGNETITLSGDVTGSGTTAITTTIAAGAVDIAMLSATGTPSSATYLRGDGTWATPAGSSPLTTKGDIFTYSTSDARLAVGTNGTVLMADSAQTTGLKWGTPVEDYIDGGSITTITSSSGVATPDASNGKSQKFPLTENVSDFNPPTNLDDGASMLVQVLQDTTPRTFALDAAYKLMGAGVVADINGLASGEYAWLTISRYGTDYLISITTQA